MSTFKTSIPPLEAAADPAKHVRYSAGMVLGVSDFVQEFAWHNNRHDWLARDLAGYGVVSGLEVRAESGEVVVQPGSAVTPRDISCVCRCVSAPILPPGSTVWMMPARRA